ncbi:hypothetical protein QJS04_geneDACA003082 [Acorus gramineus]|uniref:NAD(P)H dehydrogenase subunit CRR3, chloroplastic n=1 Tax=Acorus gramineus TaxID=55184 RepID=A0AAV9BSN8_ACOGR|nr:hypothetical protein QJS04_geneDACA003082 [Acorus gramineus]
MAWIATGTAVAATSTTSIITVASQAPQKRPNLRRRSSEPPPTQNQQQQQPSVAEIQRAITSGGSKTTGAGKFGASSGGEGRSSAFMDLLASTPIGMPESSIERKLRETGEWIIDQTEGKSRLGQEILMAVCLKILPVWLLMLLVASGIVKLPFHIPFLDDLLM